MDAIDCVHCAFAQTHPQRAPMTKTCHDASVRLRLAALGRYLVRRAGKLGIPVCNALHKTRRREATRVIAAHAHLIVFPAPARRPVANNSRTGTQASPDIKGSGRNNDDQIFAMRMTCPITTVPCEGGDLPPCEDYGCARKGGLLPASSGFY